MINIPSHTPDGKHIETIAVSVSGGIDSSLLLYLLAKQTKLTIQPVTIKRKRPVHHQQAIKVVNRIRTLLRSNNINKVLLHDVSHTTDWKQEKIAMYSNVVEDFRSSRYQLRMTGCTKTPPVDVMNTCFNSIDGTKEDEYNAFLLNRGDGTTRKTIEHDHDNGIETFTMKPFINLNKRDIANLYNDNNLLESLFPYTRSCETANKHLWNTHCGECWSCEERMWGFGRLV